MGHSLALALYLGLSRRLEPFAERHLKKRLARGKEDPGRFREKLGFTQAKRPVGRLVWFHAASVGESLSLLSLLSQLREERPDISALITTVTRTSSDMLRERLPENCVHQFAPMDAMPVVDRFLERWKPDLAIWTESEFWPCLMVRTRKAGIPMLLINARISSKSHAGWRWFPAFIKSLLNRYDRILAQDRRTARYARRLGAKRERIEVSGTLKEDSDPLPDNPDERLRLRPALDGRQVWLAASTHPGEERIIAQAHKAALKSAHGLLLIVAPRHPERGSEVAGEFMKLGLKTQLRTEAPVPDRLADVYVANTLGEMGIWYRIAPVSFLGGSLAPIGGHNPFEPAALGSAVIHGPHVRNFEDIYERLIESEATAQVKNADSLAKAAVRTLNPEICSAMAFAAWEACASGGMARKRAMELIEERLPKEGGG